MKKCHKEKANSLTICNQVERLKIKENQKRRWNCELTKGKEIDEQFGKKRIKKEFKPNETRNDVETAKKTEKKNQLNNYEKKRWNCELTTKKKEKIQ